VSGQQSPRASTSLSRERRINSKVPWLAAVRSMRLVQGRYTAQCRVRRRRRARVRILGGTFRRLPCSSARRSGVRRIGACGRRVGAPSQGLTSLAGELGEPSANGKLGRSHMRSLSFGLRRRRGGVGAFISVVGSVFHLADPRLSEPPYRNPVARTRADEHALEETQRCQLHLLTSVPSDPPCH
jgi:hypothetical protein